MSNNYDAIADRVRAILDALPPGVTLVAAAKERTVDEVAAACRAGVTHAGHNYVQEAREMIPQLRDLGVQLEWHMIGHLQRNKVRYAIDIFDTIDTLDSWRLAREIEKRCANEGRVMPVLVEVNSGREAAKTGVLPDDLDDLVRRVAKLPHLQIHGLMTMGPRFGDPENARPYFRATRKAFESLKSANLPRVDMRYLSMGMSNSYQVALEEGANVVRIGTALFGERGS